MTPLAAFSIIMTLVGVLFGWYINDVYHKKMSDKKKKIEEEYCKRVINARHGYPWGVNEREK